MNMCKGCVHWYAHIDTYEDQKHRCLELESVLYPEEGGLYTSPEFGCNLWLEAPGGLIENYPLRVAEEEAYAEEWRRNAPPSHICMADISDALQKYYIPEVVKQLDSEPLLLRALRGASPAATGEVRYIRTTPLKEEDPK